MEKGKVKVLVVGGTGYMGRRLVRASLGEGHDTYVVQRPELGLQDIDKLQMLLAFKRKGAHLVEASFDDHQSLVDAVKKADVVISAMSGVHFRSHNLLLQLRLVDAIKDAGNVKRFLPSEFGMDPSRMAHALEPGRVSFDEKMQVRKAIEEAQIPFTYVVANCFAGYFVPGLAQMGRVTPPKDKVFLYAGGDTKVAFMDEDDVATYAIKTIADPRTLNKTLHIRPPDNILTQRQLVETWERISCTKLHKITLPAHDFLASMDGEGPPPATSLDFASQVGVGHFYHIFYEGCLTNFEIGQGAEEASQLYPEVQYTRMDDYLKIFL